VAALVEPVPGAPVVLDDAARRDRAGRGEGGDRGLAAACNVLDFIENFHAFETKRGKTTKKLARYQQFEAANDIVGRVVKGEDLTGLIWHTQGSGKTLTMIFAGYKLRRRAELENPTVMIVVDRRDLKKQIADDFDYCEYPAVERAMGVRDLKEKIQSNWRGTVITTLQCFQQMDDLPPRKGEQAPLTVLLIDEAHRSQKGKGAGFAMTMRRSCRRRFGSASRVRPLTGRWSTRTGTSARSRTASRSVT